MARKLRTPPDILATRVAGFFRMFLPSSDKPKYLVKAKAPRTDLQNSQVEVKESLQNGVYLCKIKARIQKTRTEAENKLC